MVLEGSQQITQITQIIFLPTEIIFANEEHEEHEVFYLVNRFFLPTENTKNTKVFILSTDYTDYTEN